MKVVILSKAKQELLESIQYYNCKKNGLGIQFATIFKEALKRINDSSGTWPKISEKTHRYLLKKFPYAILYQIQSDQIIILAIMHMTRDPEKWKERI